jgi:hypothetical protein
VLEALGDWLVEALRVPAPDVACGEALGEWLREPDAQALVVLEALGDWQGEALGVTAPEVACGEALGEGPALLLWVTVLHSVCALERLGD